VGDILSITIFLSSATAFYYDSSS